MSLLLSLILFPLLVAVVLLFADERLRDITVKAAAVIIPLYTLGLVVTRFNLPFFHFAPKFEAISRVMLAVEIILGAYIFMIGLKYRKYWISLLIFAQLALLTGFELAYGRHLICENCLFVDKLSIIMALIIGIIGSLIGVYSLGYMQDFHAHYYEQIKDNRKFFFFLIFVFLSAMFGIIFSNNLLWLYFFWEITTLCSFLLIRYKQTDEAINNASLALVLNLLGGLAFAAAIVYLYSTTGVIELDKMIALGKAGALVPAVLISFAGLTKSAQMPFSSWLLGAMVAPTPVSALLHSSTMVKAGVYIIIRLAPVLQGTFSGLFIALIGGVTFLLTSLIAITQSNAKRVLAYSTIANLGLIVMCGGIGTYEAVWAGTLLIIFHAIAKCLLFLNVGIIEHKVHSRDIEDMTGLVVSMPRTSIMMQIGMAGMFLAPFGMLISKWAVLKALVDFNPLLAVFIVFGSAATLFFWVKWMGKLLEVVKDLEDLEAGIHLTEWVPLYILAGLTIGVCAFYPLVSSWLIEPFVREVYGRTTAMSQGNIIIMSIMMAMIALFPLSFINYGKKVKVVDAYLGGANADSSIKFYGAAGVIQNMEMKNYYMEKYFGESKLTNTGLVLCVIFIVVMVGAAFL